MQKFSELNIITFSLIAAFVLFAGGYHGGKLLAKHDGSMQLSAHATSPRD